MFLIALFVWFLERAWLGLGVLPYSRVLIVIDSMFSVPGQPQLVHIVNNRGEKCLYSTSHELEHPGKADRISWTRKAISRIDIQLSCLDCVPYTTHGQLEATITESRLFGDDLSLLRSSYEVFRT